MSNVLQETVTGSTLNGRKEYLKANEGDKDKWEFLSFADAWTPSETVLPLEGNTGSVKDDVFFTHVSSETANDNKSSIILQGTVIISDIIVYMYHPWVCMYKIFRCFNRKRYKILFFFM